MEFDKAKVFTALNADELRAGDKVIVADDLATLKCCVKANDGVDTLYKVEDESGQYRFGIISDGCEVTFALAYLVERQEAEQKAEINLCDSCKDNFCECPAVGDNIKFGNGKGNDNVIECKSYKPKTEQQAEQKNCTDDEELKKLINTAICDNRFEIIAKAREHIIDATNIEQSPDEMKVLDDFLFRCWQIGWLDRFSEVKTKQESETPDEKHYRPFRDTDELIAHWLEIGGKWQKRELTMPFIWVRNKSDDRKVWLINDFDKRMLDYLFTNCEFLDGSPCGVEE